MRTGKMHLGLFLALLFLTGSASADCVFPECKPDPANSFGLRGGVVANEHTLAALASPTYTFTPSGPMSTIYVSCDPVVDAGCDDFDNGGDNREKVQSTATGGTATTLTDTTLIGTESDDFYNGMTIRIIDGVGAGQQVFITDYVDATGVVTVADWLGPDPDTTSVYVILDQTLDGGDLPGGNDLYPGTRERPIATLTKANVYVDCNTRIVLDSKDKWSGSTNYGDGFGLLNPACAAGMTDEIGVLITVTTPGDHAFLDATGISGGGDQAAGLSVAEATSTAWVAAEWLHFKDLDEEGAEALNNSHIALNNVKFFDIVNLNENNNHIFHANNASRIFCNECSGRKISKASNQGTPYTVLRGSSSITIGGEIFQVGNNFSNNLAALSGCGSHTVIGTRFIHLPDPDGTDDAGGIQIQSSTGDSECSAGDSFDVNIARAYIEHGDGASGDAAFEVESNSVSDGMVVNVGLYFSTGIGGRNGIILGDGSAATANTITLKARGMVFEDIVSNWWQTSNSTKSVRDADFVSVDVQNCGYDDEDASGWRWRMGTSTTAITYEVLLGLSDPDDIPSHWTMCGSAENGTGDGTSQDFGGDGVIELFWDENNTAGDADDRLDFSCDPSVNDIDHPNGFCHQAGVEDYGFPLAFPLLPWMLGGEGTATFIQLKGKNQDLGWKP